MTRSDSTVLGTRSDSTRSSHDSTLTRFEKF